MGEKRDRCITKRSRLQAECDNVSCLFVRYHPKKKKTKSIVELLERFCHTHRFRSVGNCVGLEEIEYIRTAIFLRMFLLQTSKSFLLIIFCAMCNAIIIIVILYIYILLTFEFSSKITMTRNINSDIYVLLIF